MDDFVHQVHLTAPEMLQKVKVHLLLHLPQNIVDFGPPANYNTERYKLYNYVNACMYVLFLALFRCESLNSKLRTFNVYSNRQSPSLDIGQFFAISTTLHILLKSAEMYVGTNA